MKAVNGFIGAMKNHAKHNLRAEKGGKYVN